MLKKIFRLQSSIRFQQASTIHTSFFTVRIQANHLSHARVGVVVSKRVDKRAVARNTVRRRIQACLQGLLEQLKPGNDILIIVKKAAAETSQQTVCQALTQVFEKHSYLV